MEQSRLGKLLKESREAAGYTRTALFQRTGVPVATIESWEMSPLPPYGPGSIALHKLRRAIKLDHAEMEAALLDLPDGAGADETTTMQAVRDVRTELGVSIEQLAGMLKVDAGTMIGYENGAEEAPADILLKLVRLMTSELSAGHRRDR